MTERALAGGRRVPPGPALLGYAGVIPFAALTLGAWLLPEVWDARAALALHAYGAVILSFLGGVRWGLVIAGDGTPDVRSLAASVVPSLFGWLTLAAPASLAGLLLLALGFVGQYLHDRASPRDGAPVWYPALRLRLTVAVVLCLLLAAARAA